MPQADNQNITKTSRRALLRGAATVLPALAIPSVAAAAQTLPTAAPPRIRFSGVAVSSELRARVAEYLKAQVAFKATITRKSEACAAFKRLCPPVPNDLVVNRATQRFASGQPELDIEGNTVWPPENNRPYRRLHFAEQMRALKDRHDGRSAAGRLGRRLLPIAERYEAAWHRADERSGASLAVEACRHAERNAEVKFYEVGKFRALSVHDVAMKASCYAEAVALGKREIPYGEAFGFTLAIDVVSLTDPEGTV